MTDDKLLPWPESLTDVAVFVPGTPIPQGSLRGFVVNQRAVLTQSNPKLNPWRADVHTAIRGIIGDTIAVPTGPVTVNLTFLLPRRKAEPKRATPPHTRKPDLDRLIRACLDAMTGVVFTDDAQVTHLRCMKRTAPLGDQPGVLITWRPTP